MKTFIIIVSIFYLCYSNSLFAKSVMNIATLSDTSSVELNATRNIFIKEIRNLTHGEYELDFPANKQLSADGSIETINKTIDKLQDDKDVDIILLIGRLSSQLALQKNAFKKPTFAPFVFDVSLTNATKQNKIKIENLSFITSESKLIDELETFQSVAPLKNISILLDASQYNLFINAAKKIKIEAKQKNIILDFIPLNMRDKDIVSKIPANAQGVMVAPLSWMDLNMRSDLIHGLIKRNLPSYALLDSNFVQEGILSTLAATDNSKKLARQTALNIYAFLQGEDITSQMNVLNEKKELIINMETARAINLPLTFQLLQNATILNKTELTEPKLTFHSVANEAIRANLSIIASQLGVNAGAQDINKVRSVLFPQIVGELNYIQLNSDHVYVESGFYAEKSSSSALKIKQLLFSEKALSNLEIQKQLHLSMQAQQKALELEVIKQASILFLNILVEQTNYQIQLDNLALTEKNLELAKGRVQAGTSDASDIYYWESKIATTKQALLYANASVEKAKDSLNFILNRKISHRFITEPITLNDPKIIDNQHTLFGSITNMKEYAVLEDSLVKQGIQDSPILQQLHAQLSAQKRQLLSQERAYYSPDLFLFAEVSHVFDETRNPTAGISLEDKTDWQAGVKLSLPLYEGGLKSAKSTQTKLKLQQLETKYQENERLIQKQIRSDLHALSASYPSIELSHEAAQAAKKSFMMVRDNYAQGTRSISDLLTAQNATLVAEQSTVNSIYHFLIDTITLQGDVAAFNLFLGD